jgi:HAMP domain-containing protein
MAIVTTIILIGLLLGLLFLFRAMGRMGQQPSPRERMRHTSNDNRTPGPRATGLD